jgi:uncharacterized tellurite resistance protein B-like protein
MANFLKNLFSSKPSTGEDSERRVAVAACVLLLEIARADDKIAESEMATIRRILEKDLHLSTHEASEIFSEAYREQKEAVETWSYAETINENYTHEDKLKVIDMVWKVVYADRVLEPREDQIAHKIAYLLHLSHGIDRLQLKIKARTDFRPHRRTYKKPHIRPPRMRSKKSPPRLGRVCP